MSQNSPFSHSSKSRNKSIASDKDILELLNQKKPLANQLSSASHHSSASHSHSHLQSNAHNLPPMIDTHTRSTSLGSLVGVGNPGFGRILQFQR